MAHSSGDAIPGGRGRFPDLFGQPFLGKVHERERPSRRIEVSVLLNEGRLAPTLGHQGVSGWGAYLVAASLKRGIAQTETHLGTGRLGAI
jgi:hypothetical protein